MWNRAIQCKWRHAPEVRREFWEILKKSVSWVEDCFRRRRLTFACSRRPWAGVARDERGGDEKARIKRLCLSLSLCWRTFKLKGNKKFRTWTEKSLRVFRISRFLCSMFYLYGHPMYILHIPVYGYGTPTIAVTYNSLNCFDHMVYIPQASTCSG